MNINMETTFMNTENRKSNEPHKFALILPRRSDSKGSANMLLFTICQYIYFT